MNRAILMERALGIIAALGGNLSDDRLTDKTGANDAVHRGLMYCEARKLARAALAGDSLSSAYGTANEAGGADETTPEAKA